MPHEQWLKKWKEVLVIALIFCAVITPDGSGITMVFLFIPLILLYGIGLILTRKW